MMAFRLAKVCGRIDVDALMDEITPHQMDEWRAYYRIEPFGDEWGPASEICATVSNVLAMKDEDISTADEFRLRFEGQDAPQTNKRKRMLDPEEARKALAARYGNDRNTGG